MTGVGPQLLGCSVLHEHLRPVVTMATPEAAQAVIGVLNRVIRYAVGLGVTASVLQTSLYNGELPVHHQAILLQGSRSGACCVWRWVP